MHFKSTISKSELCSELKVSDKTLAAWLNKRYFKALKKVGYIKNQKILTPAQLNVLIDVLGINPEDYKNPTPLEH